MTLGGVPQPYEIPPLDHYACMCTHTYIFLIIRATLDKGPRSRVQRNQIFLLVKSFKLVPRPLDEGLGRKQIVI
jgi:hypothetical protein